MNSNKVSFRQFYAGKTILVTGCTGFLGKVVLEKILRTLVDVNKIFVMVRPRKGTTIEKRIEDTIFSSPIFQTVFEQQPNLKARLKDLIVPISGDLIMEGLGISPPERQRIVEEVDIIINNAASVNFDDPLLDAIQINYFGCMRMMDLAEDCKKLQSMVHVSTAYANSNREGFVEEKIYDLPGNEDPADVIQSILKMNPQYIMDNEKELIGTYPNTYTYTKSMAERSMKTRLGNLRCAIVRPSIIICANHEPVPGWIDTLAAAGGMVFSITSGLMHYVPCDGQAIVDCIPVDFTSNMILTAAVFTALSPHPVLNVAHNASSHLHPATMRFLADETLAYTDYQPYHRQLFAPFIHDCASIYEYNIFTTLMETIPAHLFMASAKVPIIGGPKNRKTARMLMTINKKMADLGKVFAFFINSQWIYESKITDVWMNQMSQEDLKDFQFDPRSIEWKALFQRFAYGIRRYIIQEDCMNPHEDYKQLLYKNKWKWFHDIKTAYGSRDADITYKTLTPYIPAVLSAQKFQDFVVGQTQKAMSRHVPNKEIKFSDRKIKKSKSKYESSYDMGTDQRYTVTFDLGLANKQLAEMNSQVTKLGIKSLIWFANKVLRLCLDGLFVDQTSLGKVKDLLVNGKRVIMMPIYKSFADFFIHTYIFHNQNIEIPFTFGHMEDTPRIKVFDQWLRKSGYIYAERQQSNIQSSYVNSAMLKEILENNQFTVLFQNEERLRSGKYSQTRQSEKSVKWLLEAYMNMASTAKNLVIVPVHVSYDRVFEQINLATEMISGENRAMSGLQVLRELAWHENGQLGSVYVKYLEPIPIHDYLLKNGYENLDHEHQEAASQKLTASLLKQQQYASPVTLNSIIAAMLLFENAKTIKMVDILEFSDVIYQYIKQKKNQSWTHMETCPKQPLVEKHIKGLGFKLQKATKKTCVVDLAYKEEDLRHLLCLAHYSIPLNAVFLPEGCLANLIVAGARQGPVSINDLFINGEKMHELFKLEHFYDYSLDEQRLRDVMAFWEHKGILKIVNDGNSIEVVDSPQAAKFLEFFIQLTQATFDTYLVTLLAIDHMCGKPIVIPAKKLIKEIHASVKELYSRNMLPHLHTCLKDVLRTALRRFDMSGFITMRSFGNKKGNQSTFIQSQVEGQEGIQGTIQFLMSVRGFTQDQFRIINDEIIGAVERTQGFIQVAKL